MTPGMKRFQTDEMRQHSDLPTAEVAAGSVAAESESAVVAAGAKAFAAESVGFAVIL